MGSVIVFDEARMLQIENETVIGGSVDGSGQLILETREGTLIAAGHVKGADGADATPMFGVTDSDTVDFTLSGAGTVPDPWNLTAQVKALPNSAIVTGFLENSYRGGSAKVKIGGSLSSVEYPWMSPYMPSGSREVNLMKVGTGFVILGQNTDRVKPIVINTAVATIYNSTTNGAIYPPIARAFKTTAGIVALSGLLRITGTPATDAIIGYLPTGYAPDTDLLLPVTVSGSTAATIRIKPDGTIRMYTAFTANWYLALDGIAFPAAGVASWTPITTWGANFESWPGWETQYGVPSYWKDPYGFMWFRGLARVKVATSADNTTIFTLSGGNVADKPQHIRATSNNAADFANVQFSTGGILWKSNSAGTVGTWNSLAGIIGVTTDARTNNPWFQNDAFSNSWVNYGSVYPNAQFCMREDGLRFLNGLIKTGTVGDKTFSMFEEEMWPYRGRILMASVSNLLAARIDIGGYRDPDNDANYSPGAVVANIGSNVWFSLDGKVYFP